MLVEEIANSRVTFYIVSEIEDFDGLKLFERLRSVKYKLKNEKIEFLKIVEQEASGILKPVSSYAGVINNNLIIKDIGENSENYLRKLTKYFPNKVISCLVNLRISGDDSVTGGIFKSFINNKLILHVRKVGNSKNDVLMDLDEKYIPKEDQSINKSLDRNEVFQIINKILEQLLQTQTLKDFKLNRFKQVEFLEFEKSDRITEAIRNFLPVIDDRRISSAWVANVLRGMTNEESKEILYPSAKEINQIIANILSSTISDDFKFLKSRNTFRNKKKEYIDEIIIGGSDRTGFSIIFNKRFLYLEKEVNRIRRLIESEHIDRKSEISIRTEHEIGYSLRNGTTWHNFATHLYYHLRYFFKYIYPLFVELEDSSRANFLINHSDRNEISFGREVHYIREKKPMLENCILAIQNNDPKIEQIIKRSVIDKVQDQHLATSYVKNLNQA